MKLDMNKILFNLAGVLIGGFAIGYVINDKLTTRTTAVCAARYEVSTLFPIRNSNGELLSPIELQAMAGGREYGVLEHASVVSGSGAPTPAVLEIKLPKGVSARGYDRSGVAPSGIGMRWSPVEVAGASSACLSYSAFVPDNFEFGEGGVLPGIFGGDFADTAERKSVRPGFGARIAWREKGSVDAVLYHPKAGESHQAGRPTGTLVTGRFEMPRGRWINIDQEVALNTPAKADGTYRLWVDGVLKLELENVPWRDDDTTNISGVIGNIGFSSYDRPSASPADTKVQVSPFELRWK